MAEHAPEVYYDQAGLEPTTAGVVPAYTKEPGQGQQQVFAAAAPQYSSPPDKSLRNPFGLGPLAFGCLIALVSAVIVGAAVGGGVGGTLSNCKSELASASHQTVTTTVYSSAPTSTASSSSSSSTLAYNYTPLNASSVETLAYSCTDSETFTTYFGQTFTLSCGEDWGAGLSGSGGGEISDLAGFIAYTLDDCLNACSYRNSDVQTFNNGENCLAVSWHWDLKNATADKDVNCWLKNNTLATGTLGTSLDYAISAAVS